MYNTKDAIAREIRKRGIEAIVCCSPDNVTYCTGFMVPTHQRNRHRRVFTIITADGDSQMIVVTVEENITRANSYLQPVIAYNEFTDDPVKMMVDFLKNKNTDKKVAIELSYLFACDYLKLKQYLPNAEFVEADEIMLQIRSVKRPEEIETIRTCCQITSKVYEMLREEARGYMTEMDIYGLVMQKLAVEGVEYPRMALGSGPRAANANAKASQKKLAEHELVRFDILGTYGNYNLDIARTAVVGKASREQVDTWARLYEVHLRSIDRVKAGESTRDIYLKFNEDMKNILGISGTLNFLGHGLGLTVHEPPYFNINSDTVLEENMVLCIEPMYLQPGIGGYHVEDCLVVKKNGADVLSDINSAKELFEIRL